MGFVDEFEKATNGAPSRETMEMRERAAVVEAAGPVGSTPHGAVEHALSVAALGQREASNVLPLRRRGGEG